MRPFPHLIGLGSSFIILAAIFLVVEKLSPNTRGQPFFRRGFGLDALYWFFTPFISGLLSRIVVIVTVVITALPMIVLLGLSVRTLFKGGYHGFGPVAHQAPWLQGIEIFLLGDLLGYWMHRLFHGRKLWSFHAIHHCSTEVDWLSSVRLHPVNEAVTRAVEVLPFVFLGFNPVALAAYAPAMTVYSIVLHANVDWTFGPLRYLIASPVFHRWHHSKEAEAIDKNFAGFVAFWDVLFDTFYVPSNRLPTNFGVADKIPESLWGQLAHPFRPAK
jgi:sterol desaturase/sphingolipid hydroxylase (fatty acid hydroxylase superfamily)